MKWSFAAALVLCLASAGCKRDRPYPVERVEIGAWGSLSRAGLTASRSDIESVLTSRLAAAGFQSVEVARDDEPPEGALKLTLDVPMAQADPPRVGVRLQLRPRAAASSSATRYESEGIGEATAGAQGESAVRAALETAIDQALRRARVQLQAAGKTDDALVKDLASPDSTVRDSAVRVLTDRRNPAVVQALLDQLGGGDADDVRRAIGALVELKETRAVPPLIELGNAHDPVFLREVIYALAGIGGEEAQAYLYTVAQGHDNAAIREAAQQALDELSRSEQKPDRGLSSREGGTGRH
ncbi:MAG TPA: HEAT repeat domain-containing protein [Myxococcaceae bacterium]